VSAREEGYNNYATHLIAQVAGRKKMATSPIDPKNLFNMVRGRLTNGGGLQTEFVALDPRKRLSILVFKNSETVTVSFTNVLLSTADAQTRVTDLEAAEVFYNDVSTDAVDYFAGDSRGLAGVKISATPAAANVDYMILQY
jgi:hypothetical protein